MKQVILGLAVLALLAIPIDTSADAPPTKVDVCHSNSANESIDFSGVFSINFGRVISVNENAVNAHVRHGDADVDAFSRLDADGRDALAEQFGVRLVNANCFTFSF